MSNSTINLFRRQNPQRALLCDFTAAQLNRDKSSEVCFDSYYKPADRKKLSISGTLQKKKQHSLKKKQGKNGLSGKAPYQDIARQSKLQNEDTHLESQQNQSLTVNTVNNPSRIVSGMASKSPAQPHCTPLYRVPRQEIIRRQQTMYSPPQNIVFIRLDKASPSYRQIPKAMSPAPPMSPYKTSTTFKASQISKQQTSADTACVNKSTDRSDRYFKGSDQKTIVPREVESIYGDSINEVLLEQSMEQDSSRQLKESQVLSRLVPDFSKIRIAKSAYNLDYQGEQTTIS